MNLTLYHSVESTCGQKVRFVLSEKQLEWTEIYLNLRKGEQFEPQYLKLNPKAVVPTLIHDDRVIRESTVIIEYIDDVFPDPPRKPDDLYARAQMRLLMKAFDDEVHPAVGILTYAIVMRHQMNELKTPEQMQEHFMKITDPARRERQQRTHADGLKAPSAQLAVNSLDRVIGFLDEALDSGPWLAGKDYSLADATAAPYMVRIEALNMARLWDNRPNIGAWLERMVERGNGYDLQQPWGSPSFSEIVARHVTEATPEIDNLIACK